MDRMNRINANSKNIPASPRLAYFTIIRRFQTHVPKYDSRIQSQAKQIALKRVVRDISYLNSLPLIKNATRITYETDEGCHRWLQNLLANEERISSGTSACVLNQYSGLLGIDAFVNELRRSGHSDRFALCPLNSELSALADY